MKRQRTVIKVHDTEEHIYPTNMTVTALWYSASLILIPLESSILFDLQRASRENSTLMFYKKNKKNKQNTSNPTPTVCAQCSDVKKNTVPNKQRQETTCSTCCPPSFTFESFDWCSTSRDQPIFF